MSILIKSMKMPEDCGACDLCTGDGECMALYGENLWNYIPDDAKYFPNDWKYEKCPLVEVPTPHGRLIDADALDYKLGASDRDIYVRCTLEEDAPTVIEAEEGEDE